MRLQFREFQMCCNRLPGSVVQITTKKRKSEVHGPREIKIWLCRELLFGLDSPFWP